MFEINNFRLNYFCRQMGFDSSKHNHEYMSEWVSCRHSYWIDSVVQYNKARKGDRFFQFDTLSHCTRGETAVQKPEKPQKTYSHTDTQAKWWQRVTFLALSASWWWRGGERGRWEMKGGKKKRSLMIKLSPDLVFDRGRSHIAMTRRTHRHTYTLPKWQAQLWPCQAT